MARNSYQKGRIEQRSRKQGSVYVLRYRLRQGDSWIEKTEELTVDNKRPCKSPKEAQKAADTRMRQVNAFNNGAVVSSLPVGLQRPMTMSELVGGELWQHHKSQLKASTAYHYNSLMKLYILPAFGPKALVDITPHELTLFFAALDKKKLSGAYRRVIYQLLQTVFETAAGNEVIERSPVRSKLHRPNSDGKEKPILTADELRAVIEAVDEEHRALFVCMALTGLRIGEVLGLWWRDVDLNSRTLKVARNLWRNQLSTPKTKASKRTLHMPVVLSEILRIRYQSSRWNGENDFVFGKADGGPLNADGLREKVLYPALKKLGIKQGSNSHGFHLFRHSAASIVHEQTRDMSLAQRLLGHSRLSTTADIYAHTESEAEQATETLAREIMGSCGPTVAEGSTQIQ